MNELLIGFKQETRLQSTEWYHSIIDWLSREASELVRQSINRINQVTTLQSEQPSSH